MKPKTPMPTNHGCWRIERPVLLFAGEEPIALFGATDGYQVKDRISSNVQIPLKSNSP